MNFDGAHLSHDQIAVFLVIVQKIYWTTCLEHGLHKPQIQINVLKKSCSVTKVEFDEVKDIFQIAFEVSRKSQTES